MKFLKRAGVAALIAAGAVIAVSQSGAQSADEGAAFTDAQREAIRAEIRAYLLAEPELLIEVSQELERRRAERELVAQAEALQTHTDLIYNDGFSWVGGNPDGDITLVEFLDYNCGFCRRAHGAVTSFIEEDGNVRLIVKEFPILGPESETAGRAALAALQQQDGALYKAFHEKMITATDRLTPEMVFAYAEEVGLDVETLRADMDSDEVTRQVTQNRQLAQDLGVQATPTFILGDELIRGAVDKQYFAAIAEFARANAEE